MHGPFHPWHRRGVPARQREDSWSDVVFHHASSSEHDSLRELMLSRSPPLAAGTHVEMRERMHDARFAGPLVAVYGSRVAAGMISSGGQMKLVKEAWLPRPSEGSVGHLGEQRSAHRPEHDSLHQILHHETSSAVSSTLHGDGPPEDIGLESGLEMSQPVSPPKPPGDPLRSQNRSSTLITCSPCVPCPDGGTERP